MSLISNSSNPSIINYLSSNDTAWFPLSLNIKLEDGKTKKTLKQIDGRYPKTTDFKTFTEEQIIVKQSLITQHTHIAINTWDIHHLDVDFQNGVEYPKEFLDFANKYKSMSPYYKSSSKVNGIHILFKSKNKILKQNQKLKFIHDNDKVFELLAGMWGWCHKDAEIFNSHLEIPTLDLEEYYLKDEKPKKKESIPKLLQSNDKLTQAINKAEYNEDKQKKQFELLNIARNIDIRYLDDYQTWIKILWGLSSYKPFNLKDVAIEISKKSKKYNEETFNNIWNQKMNKINIGTIYYYSKLSNPEKHNTIKLECFNDNNGDFSTDEGQANYYLNDNLINLVYKNDVLYINQNNCWYEDLKLNRLRNSISSYLIPEFKKVKYNLQKQQKKYNEDIAKLKDNIRELEQDNNNTDLTMYISFLDEKTPEINKQKIEEEKIRLMEGYKSKISEYLIEQTILSGKYPSEDKMNKIIAKISDVAKSKSISEKIIHKLSVVNYSNIEFDANGYLFPFNNQVYDLKKHVLRDYERDDYILTKTKYEYIKSTPEQLKKLDGLLKSINPDEAIRINYLSYLCCALYGVPIEKFVIANGGGGNGKGVLSELMEDMLDTMCYVAPNAILLEPFKQGANPALANMHNKRLIIYREPDETNGTKILGSVMKELTGGKKLNARKNHSNDCEVLLKAVHILECNGKPKISGRADNSLLRRLADVLFSSTFSQDPNLYNNKELYPDVYKADPFFKSDEFRDEYKTVLFDYLINLIKSIDDFKPTYVKDCDEVIERTKQYLQDSDEFHEWFLTVYQRCDSNKTITVQNVFDKYKDSDIYEFSSRKDKREFTKKKLVEYFGTDIKFKLNFVDKKRGTINGSRVTQYNYLFGYEEIEGDEAIDTEEY